MIGGAEGGQVGVELVVLADIDVGHVARRLGAAVHGVMLGRGNGAIVARIVALQARHEGDAHAAGQEGIFAVGLLAAAPARIAEDVDVRRPEVEALEDIAECPPLVFSACMYLMRPSVPMISAMEWIALVSNVAARPIGSGNDVTPFVFATPCSASLHQSYDRHVQPRHGTSLVHELAGLLFQRQALHQVGGALLRRKVGVQISRLVLCDGNAAKAEQCGKCG